MTDTQAIDNNNEKSNEKSEREILVVASKVKQYIRDRSGMNTSASVLEALTTKLKQICDQAVENAKQDGRKTVMDRDIR